MWYSNLAGLAAAAEEGNEEIILMSSLAACIECKVVFSDNSYPSDSVIKLTVYLRSNAPSDLLINKIQVIMENPVYSKYCVTVGEVCLESQKISKFEYQFPALSETIQVIMCKQ
ncbi:PREDICTED: trafficking protein particle complex subunit 11-like [Amphimedon queenslandica]|uniref:Uncharacterized protein n=2 Tax=Amphimedon queenslandica TaxID=400682 RepID=A0AAN0K4K5_AMPQE|nr:PREDICTED: trafficking protein particle complex subunit 11-like [Amphimedon queenslandica]|eukprot:XP_019864119.1 PREDICTED: trafficking protein particle complex subunit 11-like [Amphimedon queenslandica]